VAGIVLSSACYLSLASGEQRPGSAIALFAAALYHWLFYWDAGPDPDAAATPALSDAALSGAGDEDGGPAHLMLSAPLRLNTGDRDAHWLLAESSWAGVFTEPQFLGLARWVWKVSTCLLVLQFVTPMRRHWQAASAEDAEGRKPRRRDRATDRALAGIYLLFMGTAAMLSVLLAALLLVVALTAYLPIPRIDQAVRWIVVHTSAMLGDSYMLAHCPVQFAAMRTQVARDLAWLQGRCEKVAVVAHSQGAALAHRVLKDSDYSRDNLKAFITFGQGISKLELLWQLDWNLQARRKAHRSRVLVTSGMACAGLPAVGWVLGHWVHAALVQALTGLPWLLVLLIVGFACIASGVRQAVHAVCDEVERKFSLPQTGFTWNDYYASADPVANGPLVPPRQQHQTGGDNVTLLPRACDEVYNSASVTFDHNGYLRNQDDFLPRLLNDLVDAAYGDTTDSAQPPELVPRTYIKAASRRRRRLVRWLVTARIAAVALFTALTWTDPGKALEHPMRHLTHLLAAPTAMSSDPAVRVLFAAATTTTAYLAAVAVWQAAIRYSTLHFFHHTNPATTPTHVSRDALANQVGRSGLPSRTT
jgi:hypothetical protein